MQPLIEVAAPAHQSPIYTRKTGLVGTTKTKVLTSAGTIQEITSPFLTYLRIEPSRIEATPIKSSKVPKFHVILYGCFPRAFGPRIQTGINRADVPLSPITYNIGFP